MSRGFFITFEGLDGSGKSTQLKKLARTFDARNEPVTVTRQPGGTALGDRVRSLLLDSRAESPAPKAELAMMFADRAQCIHQIITPALERGETVLCDRFTDSTEAYQGGGRQLGSDLVRQLHKILCGNLQPDLTILLMPPFERSLNRARRRNQRVLESTGRDENRFENLDTEFFRRTYDMYRTIADRDSVRVVVIDGEAGIEEVFSSILGTVDEKLNAFRRAQSQPPCL
jgi:dTMP kinase